MVKHQKRKQDKECKNKGRILIWRPEMTFELRSELGEGTSFLQIRDKNILNRGNNNTKTQEYSRVYSKNNGSNASEAKQTEIARGKVSQISEL